MDSTFSKHFVKTMVPYVRIAGQYALSIQHRVASQPDKAGQANKFAEALTDGDMSIQTFIEVALLAHFPDVMFYGEEEQLSYNARYFPRSGKYRVLLDPIDGTCFYKDGRKDFNVILSLTSERGYEAAIVYIPAREKLICFEGGQDLYFEVCGNMCSFQFVECSNTLVTINLPEHTPSLRKHYRVFDILEDYDRAASCPNVNAIFLGEAVCFLGTNNSSIDWGVQAAIVQAAGGTVTDFNGEPLGFDFRNPGFLYENMIVAVNKNVHEKVLACVRGV